MKIKMLLMICVGVFVGQAVAKEPKCPIDWPWAKGWHCAETLTVTTTKAYGEGSFREAIEEASLLDNPAHIVFCLSKDDKGYDCNKKSWTIKVPEACVVNNKVWIDGFSQKGSCPNTNKQCEPNNARWKVELEGVTAAPNSCGLDFQAGSEGSVVTGMCFCSFTKEKGWLSAIRTRSCDVTICGVACSTDTTGSTDKPNTCSVFDTGISTRLGVKCMEEARSIWGGLGSKADNEGAITLRGHNARLVGGTLGLNKCGSAALNADAEIGILVTTPQAMNGSSTKIDSIVAAGFSECVICLANFDNVQISNSFIGTDCANQQPITPTKIAIEAINTSGVNGGVLEISGNIIGGVDTAINVGGSSTESLEKVVVANNDVGTTVPNKDNIVVSQSGVVEVTNNNSSNATEGTGLTLGVNIPMATATDNTITNNSVGIVAQPITVVQVMPAVVAGGSISGNGTGVVVETSAVLSVMTPQLAVTSPIFGGLGVLTSISRVI